MNSQLSIKKEDSENCSTNMSTPTKKNPSNPEKSSILTDTAQKNSTPLIILGLEENELNEISGKVYQQYSAYFSSSYDPKNMELPSQNFMNKHQINSIIRTKMVNWMIDVLTQFGSDELTFFTAVNIMDKYLSFTEETIINATQIYLIGVVSIFASVIKEFERLASRMGIFTNEDYTFQREENFCEKVNKKYVFQPMHVLLEREGASIILLQRNRNQ